jgi:hypothetical protein
MEDMIYDDPLYKCELVASQEKWISGSKLSFTFLKRWQRRDGFRV